MRSFEHSKEGTWMPQVVVTLAVTAEGLPVKSWVLPGNTADVSAVKRVLFPPKTLIFSLLLIFFS